MAHDIQYHFKTRGDAMYAPCERSSFASVCSTRFRREVTFFALSFGTVCPQFTHWTVPEDPLPPFLLILHDTSTGMDLACVVAGIPLVGHL